MAEDKKFDGIVRGIGFWGKSSGAYCSYYKGLTKPDLEYLRSLKEGDRFVLYPNSSENPKDPHLTLRRFWREGEVMNNGQVYHDTFKDKLAVTNSDTAGNQDDGI